MSELLLRRRALMLAHEQTSFRWRAGESLPTWLETTCEMTDDGIFVISPTGAWNGSYIKFAKGDPSMLYTTTVTYSNINLSNSTTGWSSVRFSAGKQSSPLGVTVLIFNAPNYVQVAAAASSDQKITGWGSVPTSGTITIEENNGHRTYSIYKDGELRVTTNAITANGTHRKEADRSIVWCQTGSNGFRPSILIKEINIQLRHDILS